MIHEAHPKVSVYYFTEDLFHQNKRFYEHETTPESTVFLCQDFQ